MELAWVFHVVLWGFLVGSATYARASQDTSHVDDIGLERGITARSRTSLDASLHLTQNRDSTFNASRRLESAAPWENVVKRKTSGMKWQALKLQGYRGEMVERNEYCILVVYDIISSTHFQNLDLFLAYMEAFQSISSPKDGGAEASATPSSPKCFRYLFLTPRRATKQLTDRVQQFCASTTVNNMCTLWTKTPVTGSEEDAAESIQMFSHDPVASISRFAMNWDELFGIFKQFPPDVDAVFVLRSNFIGPIHSHFAPKSFNIFTAYTQYLSPSTPVVLSDAYVNYRSRKALITLHNHHFPLLFTKEVARILGRHPLIGKKWVMSLLATGLNVHIIEPRFAKIDWLKYYNLCWLKGSIQLIQCKNLENTIMTDHHSVSYEERLAAMLNGIVGFNDEEATGVTGAPALDAIIRTPQYQTHISGFHDVNWMSSEEEYRTQFVSVLQKQIHDLSALSAQNAAAAAAAAASASAASTVTPRPKTLVVYVYYESGQESIDSFLHFQEHALVPSNLVDFIIIVNGDYSIRMPKQFNVQVIYRNNHCFDIGSWGHIITYLYMTSKHVSLYKYFIVMNNSVRGPYLPPTWNFEESLWTDSFTSQLDDSVKLVGLAANCPDGVGRKYLHLMSMILAFDAHTIEAWMLYNQPPSYKEFLQKTIEEERIAGFANIADFSGKPFYRNISTVLFCPAEKVGSYQQESDVTMAILAAGYNIKSMQPYYQNIVWQAEYKRLLASPLVSMHGHYNTCPGILLDIFYQGGWNDQGTTPHPYDFVFIKTNRGIYGEDLHRLDYLVTDYRKFSVPANPTLYAKPISELQNDENNNFHLLHAEDWKSGDSPAYKASLHKEAHLHRALEALNPSGYFLSEHNHHYHASTGYAKTVVLLSHSLELRETTLWLTRVAAVLTRKGYTVKVFGQFGEDGKAPLAEVLHSYGVEVVKTPLPMPSLRSDSHAGFQRWFKHLEQQLRSSYCFFPTLYLFNSVMFLRFMSVMPMFSSHYTRTLWAVHETDLFAPVQNADGYYYAQEWPELLTMNSAYFGADKTIFLSHSGREYVSKFDHGQFTTIHAFVDDTECSIVNNTIHKFVDISEARRRSREILGIPQDAFVITNIGAISRSRQQHWLVDLLHESKIKNIHNRKLFVVMIGFDGSSNYENEIKKYIENANLTSQILLVAKNSLPLAYAAAADLHTSISTHEGFPLSTLEIMCLGTPLLATPASGVREQIIFPGNNGILLKGIHDYDHFLHHIRQFFQTDQNLVKSEEAMHKLYQGWKYMGLQGMRTAQDYFSRSAIEPFYEQLLASQAPNRAHDANKVCIVMRFHGGQLGRKDNWYNLEEAIRSVYAQEHTNWELLLVPSDTGDISAVYPLLVRYNRYLNRQQAASSEVISTSSKGGRGGGASTTKKHYVRPRSFNKIRLVMLHEYLMKYDVRTHGAFHQRLYEITDMAIQQCSPDANWLMISNGDNTYHESMLTHLDSNYDIIAYDFYSRWWKHLQTDLGPCDRLMITKTNNYYSKKTLKSIKKDAQYFYQPGKSLQRQEERVANSLACIPNHLSRNHTDLGANIVNLKRWFSEGHKYSQIVSNDASHDGTMMEILVGNQWAVKHVTPSPETQYQCMFDHNPNYHSCLSMSQDMYWDDSKHICYHRKELLERKVQYRESKLHHCILSS